MRQYTNGVSRNSDSKAIFESNFMSVEFHKKLKFEFCVSFFSFHFSSNLFLLSLPKY